MDAQEKAYLSNYWWALTLRGLAAILFGLAAVFWPGITLVTLVYLFSAYVLASGIVSVVFGLVSAGRAGMDWMFTLLLGFLEVGVGVYLLRHIGVSFATFILLIGLVLVVRGVMELVAAFTETSTAADRNMLMIAGAISVLAGIVVLRQPESAGVAFVWVLGVFALITGPMLIAFSIDAKRLLDADNRPRNGRARA